MFLFLNVKLVENANHPMALEKALPNVECEVPVVGKQIGVGMRTAVDGAECKQ